MGPVALTPPVDECISDVARRILAVATQPAELFRILVAATGDMLGYSKVARYSRRRSGCSKPPGHAISGAVSISLPCP